MLVFSDFHHASLLHSLILLFENRLKGRLYRPIGRAWHTAGYWKVYDHPATIGQFLDIGGANPDGTDPVNEVVETSAEDGNRVYVCHDIDSHETNRAITLDGFLNMPFDVIIASIPQHIIPFRELSLRHPNKPILLFQVGNAWNISPQQEDLIDGILASAKLRNTPNKPFVEYHQEFDLKVFHPPIKTSKRKEIRGYVNSYDFSMPKEKKITSMVNCFNTDQLFAFDYQIFQNIEKKMPEWEFKVLGGGCRDGSAHGMNEVAETMRNSRFIWHTKNGGDGYGHIIHNSASVGRPAIVRKGYYAGKMAESLMRDGETCIAIDGLSEDEIINKILHFSDEKRYEEMSRNVYNNFVEQVNFDNEASEIEKMLISILKNHGKSIGRLSGSSTLSD